MASSHPNAIVTLLTTGAAGVAYKVAHRYGWVDFSAEDGLLAAGAAASFVLFVGRRGPVQTAAAVWSWVRFGADKPGTPFFTMIGNGTNTLAAPSVTFSAPLSAPATPGTAPAATPPPVAPDLP